MSLCSRLCRPLTRMFGRSNGDEESRRRRRRHDERFQNLSDTERDARKAGFKEWKTPEQEPASAVTVFLAQFRRDPESFFRENGEGTTIYGAWSRLSHDRHQQLMVEAKRNEIHNTAKLAKFNKFCPLSPSVEDLTSTWASMAAPDQEDWLLTGPRGIALQRWERYRYDHPRACGGREMPVPEVPFPIMNLVFELRREIFSIVLRRSCPVLQFPPDRSADAFGGLSM